MVSTSTHENVVEAAGLTKIFRDFWMRAKAKAIDSIDFEIGRGEVFGLLGPNGSGKSTTIKIILGLLHQTRGRMLVFGQLPSDVSIKKRIGFLPEESYLYRFLNPLETLDYYGRLFGIERRIRMRRAEELLDMVGLAKVAHRPVGEFSKGMQRRIGLAQALVNDPEFLILDEPTSGLDPIGTRQVKDVILELGRRGKTILLSSHLLADVEDVCSRVVILYGGKIRAQGTADELLRDTNSTIIKTHRLKADTISRIESVLQDCEGLGIEQVEAPRQRLEQLFLDIVEKAQQEQVETSGASHSGETAAFLRGETHTGAQVIEDLVQADASELSEPADTELTSTDERESHNDEVLAELLGTASESDIPQHQQDITDSSKETPHDVDRGVIDSLLGESEGSSTSDTPRDEENR